MEQLPNWLAAAVDAAGMATVYNADDWDRFVDKQARPATPLAAPQHPGLTH